MFDIIRHTIATNVADDATFTVAYPAGRNAGDYVAGGEHFIGYGGQAKFESRAGHFSAAFGTANITITNTTGGTLMAGVDVIIQLDRLGGEGKSLPADPVRMIALEPMMINLGAPDVADPNGVCESQAVTVETTPLAEIDGALASGGVATFDTPRNVVAAWTGTAVVTVTGTDQYGNTVVESSASGTSLAGKKAFKTVTSVSFSADVTGVTVGTGDVFGLPVFLPSTGYVLAELEDGAAASAGTVVAGVTTAATATTGDVRGTYDPNSAADGEAVFALVVALPDPGDKGVAQFAG
jgi:hypothetical protein